MAYEGLDPCGPTPNPRVQALRAAYRKRRLVVSRDPGALGRARLQDGHAIDAREVAEVMLAELIQVSGGRLPAPFSAAGARRARLAHRAQDQRRRDATS